MSPVENLLTGVLLRKNLTGRVMADSRSLRIRLHCMLWIFYAYLTGIQHSLLTFTDDNNTHTGLSALAETAMFKTRQIGNDLCRTTKS